SRNPMAICKGNGNAPAPKDILNPPLIPEVKGRVCFSLFFKLENAPTGESWEVISEKVFHKLMQCRFAGGDIVSVGKGEDKSQVYSLEDEQKLAKIISRSGWGWFIKDRS